MNLPILFQDQDVVVVNKSAGLLVHRSVIDPHAKDCAMRIVRDQLGQWVYPVHRLDRPTSGALVFGLSASSARSLAQEFAQGRVTKIYHAIVRGTITEQISLDYPLKEELDHKSDRLAQQNKAAQSAVTHFKRLGSHEISVMIDKYPTTRYSLVEARPETGRKHQIRRHLRHLDHPIIGDVEHGSGKHNRFFREHFGVRRLLLACTSIAFLHPRENRIVTVNAPLSEDFLRIKEAFRWN